MYSSVEMTGFDLYFKGVIVDAVWRRGCIGERESGIPEGSVLIQVMVAQGRVIVVKEVRNKRKS